MFSVAVENVKQNPTLLDQLKKLLFNRIVERYYNIGCSRHSNPPDLFGSLPKIREISLSPDFC